MPEAIDWFVWRPVFAQHVHVSKAELDTHWSLVDLVDCHELLDIHDELERRAYRKVKSGGKR